VGGLKGTQRKDSGEPHLVYRSLGAYYGSMAWAPRVIAAWICGLAMVALPVFGGQPKHPPDTIVLYTKFDHEPPQEVKAALQVELGSIMAPLGLSFEWRELAGDRDEPAIKLAVISFKGFCEADGVTSHSSSSRALGSTHISNGVILPFSDVDCDGIRVFLRGALRSLSSADREEAYGRALARVLAHELYHIFAETTRHGSCGVGKETYSVRDLLAVTFRFDDRESQELLNSKAHEFLERGRDLPD